MTAPTNIRTVREHQSRLSYDEQHALRARLDAEFTAQLQRRVESQRNDALEQVEIAA